MSNDQVDPSIRAMRNLGPACQRDLHQASIYTAEEVVKLGPKEAFLRIIKEKIARGGDLKCINAAYLYALYGAVHDVDWREVPEQVKREYKQLTARLRRQMKR